MKSLILCVSKYYGNTRKLAEAMAPILNVQIVGTQEAKDVSLLNYDLVGFGSGIYFGKHDADLLSFVDSLPVTKKRAFIFSSRGRNSLFEKAYHKTLKEKLVRKGFDVVGEFSCRGFSDYYRIFKLFGGVNKGHPNEKELEKARTFASNLREGFF